MSIELIDTVVPKNAGTFAIADAQHVKGGYMSVADATARNAIPSGRRRQGMLVRTNDTGALWTLNGDLTSWTEVIGSGSASRFFQAGTVQTIYVRPSTGSDTTGDGLTALTAYATVQRALEDVPNGFTCYAVVDIEAGTFATQQNWAVSAQPGYMDPAETRTGHIYIVGDSGSPDLTLASTGSGTLVSGKRAQMRFSVGAYGASITDGSHWLKVANAVVAGVHTARVCLASTSPDLDVVSTVTTAMTSVTVNPYTTTFSGAVRMAAPQGTAFGGNPFVTVMGIKFTSTVQANNIRFEGCQAASSPVVSDCLVAGLAIIGGNLSASFSAYARGSISNLLIKDGSLVIAGMCGSLIASVFKGTVATTKIAAGFTGSVLGQLRAPGGANVFQECDLEGDGDGVWLSSSSILGNGSSGTSVTFSLTAGRAFILDHGSRLVFGNGTHAWTGAATVASVIKNGSCLAGGSGGFGVTNTATPGDDLVVGSGPFRALDDFYTDLGDLSRYAAVV